MLNVAAALQTLQSSVYTQCRENQRSMGSFKPKALKPVSSQ